jgi:AcrR family transcriptional regulator
MSTRENQKNARRTAILDAARTLILEDKSRDFSMPDLAEKAGVSLVTPYNLFGSKSSILLEIARQDIFERAAEIDLLPCSSLPQWIADLARTLGRVYYRNRHFYRRMIVTLVAQESPEGQREMLALGYGMFAPPIARLQTQGILSATLPAAIVAQHLSHAVSGALQHRLMERVNEETLRRDIEIGIALTLAGLSGDADRAALLQRLDDLGGAPS